MSAFYMEARPDTIAARARGAAIACGLALVLAVLMTWPLASGLGRLGRTTNMDGLYGIWNVGWVSRTIVTDPGALFDANIFYPHRSTLAYSEANIVAGVIGIPAWLLTGNAYAAHNTALLFAFASTFLGMWLLARYLSGRADAAAVAAMLFAFCPYFYSHSAHVQLLMAGGMPLSLLALHRLADAPSLQRGAALGAALAAQALACAYYGIFAGLMVGYGVFLRASPTLVARERILDRDRRSRGRRWHDRPSISSSLPRTAGRRLRPVAGRCAEILGDVAELSRLAVAFPSTDPRSCSATRMAARRSTVSRRSCPRAGDSWDRDVLETRSCRGHVA